MGKEGWIKGAIYVFPPDCLRIIFMLISKQNSNLKDKLQWNRRISLVSLSCPMIQSPHLILPHQRIQIMIFKVYQAIIIYKSMPKNITNGEFIVNYNEEDKVDENYKFIRAPNNDSIDILKNQNSKIPTNYYIESTLKPNQDIRTGQFTQISESYMIETSKEKSNEPVFTTNSFDTEMKLLFSSLQQKMNRATTFFQGIFTGMALLYTITLSLSGTISSELVRVEDQTIRIVSILSSFGSIYSFLVANQHYDFIKLKGRSSEIDVAYKAFILSTIQMIFYTASYVIYNVSHTFAVKYNISGGDYAGLKQTTTTYTVLCILAWIFTNVNTYKYERQA